MSQPNAGHAVARNHGIRLATGDFIGFIDADDLWHPEKLERQLRLFAARPELGIVFSHLENFVSPDVDLAELPPTGDAPCASMPGYSATCMLVRREVFDRVGLLDETLKHGNDRDWLCRAAEQSVPMEMLPDVLLRRRLHKTNRSSALADRSRSEYLRIIKASLDRRRREAGEPMAYPFKNRGPG
jgi:glycosyltransferase involved in cell wall biosynthesis